MKLSKNTQRKTKEIIGREPQLSDIFLAINQHSDLYSIDIAKLLEVRENTPNLAMFLVGTIINKWSLTQDLYNQSEPTIEFLYQLLNTK